MGKYMDYKIEAIDILLNETCILQRYYPLIQYKKRLIKNLRKNQYFTKRECLNLPDETLIKMGLPGSESANLFRSFLTMYDIKESKLKEISRVVINEYSYGDKQKIVSTFLDNYNQDGCDEKMDWEFIKWILWEGRSKTVRERYKSIQIQYPDKVSVIKNQR